VALITETGAGLSDAESLCSVEAANAYHAKRGNLAWATLASDEARETMLVRATDYMEAVYKGQWAGMRKNAAQALSWPRYLVPIRDLPIRQFYPDNVVPPAVVNACAELALRAIKGELAPDVKRLAKRVKVDVIETEYVDGASPYTRFRLIDKMLESYLCGSDMNIRLVRA
jgi:hypothetical protein